MVWRVTNEPVDCRPSQGTNKHTQDRKRCSLLDDNSTATADYDSAHANYTVNYIRQLQNHDYIHMTTTTSYKSILLHVTLAINRCRKPECDIWYAKGRSEKMRLVNSF